MNNDIVHIRREAVVLLHGLARSSFAMNKFASFLENNGYNVFNINYPSKKYTIEKLEEIVYLEIKDLMKSEYMVHFVGHSLGSIIIRILLRNHKCLNMGRVVMLGPPNHGSELSDFYKKYFNFFYKKAYGLAGQELTTDDYGICSRIKDNIYYELGIIAGDRTIDPLSNFLIPGDNDGRVSVKSTKLDHMKDHLTIHTTHTGLIQKIEIMEQVLYFLNNGIFTQYLNTKS